MSFCHLHVHNEFSILDGYGSAKKYLAKAKELGQEYLALTNHGNIDGLIRFQKEADEIGIKPILGCELYFVPDMDIKEPKEKRFHMTILIKNEIGFQNLCKILTESNLRGFYYKSRGDFKSILTNSEGLVFLTGCGSSCLTTDDGMNFIADLAEKNPGDLYLEVMPHQLDEQLALNQLCSELCKDKDFNLKLVATNDCHYIEQKDNLIQEVLLAIQTKTKWTDSKRMVFAEKTLFLRSEEEMKEAFKNQKILHEKDYDAAISNTIEIAKKCCDFQIKKQNIFLPVTNSEGDSEENYLYSLCKQGYQKLFGKDITFDKIYLTRLNDEFELIKKKNFIRYFLIVNELIAWCHTNGIMTGPGRGSVGGSLMAYLLGITTVDPIKYNLLFSRFIDENRTDYPDIDIDFEDIKRPLIRGHLEAMYGKNNISSVSTFMNMKGRAAIRDVARVFGMLPNEVDEFAKTIEDEENGDSSIQAALSTKEGRYFQEKFPQIVDIAIRLEGQIRGIGQHAAAVIISADDLTQGTRGNLTVRSNQEVINWDKDDAEFMGLMKLDILGLNTLTVLNETKRLVKLNYNKNLDFEKLPFNNKDVFKMLSNGDTIGVFQFNTWSTTRLLKDIKVNSLAVMSDVNALVRPGPSNSGMTADYTKRKHGEKWKKKHPIYEKITKDTFGIIVYQEQVMQAIVELAGLSYAIADKIRKIIAKKGIAKDFDQYKQIFIDGCKQKQTLTEIESNEFWDMLEKHANYSFNKSHSTTYSMIAYWCAYCKFIYPAEFICANLTYGSQGKKEEIVKEAYRLGLSIVLPAAGVSNPTQWIAKDKLLYIPFTEIKGIGEKIATQEIILTKQNKPVAIKTPIQKIASPKGFFYAPRQIKQQKIASKEKRESKGKLKTILDEIEVMKNNKDISGLSKYFSFEIRLNETTNPTPKKVHIEKNIQSEIIPELKDCLECPLSKETEYGPVSPSIGKYNIAIYGEAPGKDEDEKGIGFIGRAGSLLWGELGKYNLKRDDFYISNCAKCYPKITKTPDKESLEKCNKWVFKEIETLHPVLILVFGSTGMKTFKNKYQRITEINGTTEWDETTNAWISWCIHPSSVLHNPANRELFEDGIKCFVDKITELGGIT